MFNSVLNVLQTALIFFLVLGPLVLIHELGHFLVAKWVGVRVDEFGFGLPPMIWGKKFGETIYSINWLPIGGFVRLAGEDADDGSGARVQGSAKKRMFYARSKKQRAAILLAGVMMNFLLGIGIFSFLISQGLDVPAKKVVLQGIAPQSPAEVVGLKVGDLLVSVSYKTNQGSVITRDIKSSHDMKKVVARNLGREVDIALLRDGKPLVIPVTPRLHAPANQGAVGIVMHNVTRHVQAPYPAAITQGFAVGVEQTWDMVTGVKDIVEDIADSQGKEVDVAGPIGIAQYVGEAARISVQAVLELAAILSLNLAVINVLPLPPLDGGRLAFVVVEKILGRKVKPSFEHSAHQIGMIVFLILFALISVSDILRLARGG